MHVLVTCKNKEDLIKNEGARVFTKFFPLLAYGDYSRRSRAANSAAHSRIWSNFELFRNLMAVFITYKNEEDPIKNVGARVTTRYVEFSGAQGQITLKSVVGSGRNSNSFKFSCMCLLSARMKVIRPKMNSLEWPQHFSHYKYGDFSIHSRAANSAALGPIYPKFELYPNFMVVLNT